MRRFVLSIGMFLALTIPGFASDVIPGVVGTWQSETNADGYIHVEIALCEDKICGVIAKAFDTQGAEAEFKYLGKMMIWNMTPAANGEFVDGQIFAPDREKTYGGSLRLNGDVLIIRGCALGGLVCKEQTWTRVAVEALEGAQDAQNTGALE